MGHKQATNNLSVRVESKCRRVHDAVDTAEGGVRNCTNYVMLAPLNPLSRWTAASCDRIYKCRHGTIEYRTFAVLFRLPRQMDRKLVRRFGVTMFEVERGNRVPGIIWNRHDRLQDGKTLWRRAKLKDLPKIEKLLTDKAYQMFGFCDIARVMYAWARFRVTNTPRSSRQTRHGGACPRS